MITEKRPPTFRSPAGDAATLDLKVPPYSIEAEMSVLGSMLIDKEALERAIEMLQPESLYDSKHQKIFTLMKEMVMENKVVDIVTMTEALRSREQLREIGGAEYLTEIINIVPTAAHIDAYIRIVQEKDLLRSLINAATKVVGDCYKQDDEPSNLLDQAERLIYQIADRISTKKGLTPLSDMVPEMLETLETLHQRKQPVTGVVTGFTRFDTLTSGLQPGTLNILAARPGVGKTAFALNIALNVGIARKTPCIVYSLEMTQQEIGMRLLSALAEVPLMNLRTGFFEKAAWPKLTRKAEQLSESPIYLDQSTTGLSILNLRASARRLASQLKRKNTPLGLIIIDYLQLMQGSRKTPESRQTEIAEISRSLKGLALDLKVPIIALSQLNRSPEEHGRDGKPQLSHLRECVTGDTLVQLTDGRRIPIQDLVGQRPEVWAVTADGKIVAARSDMVWPVGRRPVMTIRLASGRSVTATADHRLFTFDGWKKVAALNPGERLAIPRRIPEPQQFEQWSDARVALLGQLIGDGSYLKHQPLRFTTASEDNSRMVAQAAEKEFGATVKRYRGRGKWHQLLIGGNGNRWQPAGVGKWLKELGIYGQRSHEKRIPDSAFRLGNRQIGILLQHLWATDGTIWPRLSGRGEHIVNFSTNSSHLAQDVAALLLRLGIVARLLKISQGKYRPLYCVKVSGVEGLRRFLKEVGSFGPRVAPALRLASMIEELIPNTNVDTLPKDIFKRVKEQMDEQGISSRQMAFMRGVAYGGSAHFDFAPSRALVTEYAELLNDSALFDHAASDLFWDRIAAIEPAGEREVYDLTVPGPSCWIANGIVSHNSGAIEQDADLVAFIYREAMYKREPTEEEQNKAKLIIAKQRNGPLGEIDLTFRKEFAKFDNFDAEHS